MQRFIQFFAHCLNSKNALVAVASKMCTTFSTFAVADNVREAVYYLCYNKIDYAFDVSRVAINKVALNKPFIDEVIWRARMIEELCNMSDGKYMLPFEKEEKSSLLLFSCTQ